MNINNTVISKMRLRDLELIKDSLENDFDDFWNYNILKQELDSATSTLFTIKQNEKILGFAGISIILDEADITNIVIKKDYRSKGLSKLLMNELISFSKSLNCTKINLEVNSINYVAINLYNKFGFEKVGLRKNYYNGQDAILMSKMLSNF